MALEKVSFTIEISEFLNDLGLLLLEKEYFGFEESAFEYIQKIITYAENKIPEVNHKTTPFLLKRLGTYYISYQVSSGTTWYIFFIKNQKRFIVTGILNNHQPEAQFLNQ